MATIVQNDLNGKVYVLLGVGYGEAKASRPHPVVDIATQTFSSESMMVAVADVDGEISWVPSFQLSVVSVDGKSCRDLISEFRETRGPKDR